jgi:hypothetical protein
MIRKRRAAEAAPAPAAPAPAREHGPVNHYATLPDRPAGFVWRIPNGMIFVPFAWLVHPSDSVIYRRQEALVRASLYGEVPPGLHVIPVPLEPGESATVALPVQDQQVAPTKINT